MRPGRKISRIRGLQMAGERFGADGPAAEVSGGVRDNLPQVLAEGPADEQEKLVLGLDEQVAGRSRDRARSKAGGRRDRRADVDRAEAGEQLGRARAEEGERREAAGD